MEFQRSATDDGREPGAAVHITSRQSLRIETHHEDRVVVLGCDSCDASVTLPTTDVTFGVAVQAFFERHASCAQELEVRGA
jgi:hypothetical protein